jgi:hypothetical protein
MVLNPTRRPKGKGQGATKGEKKSGGQGADEAGGEEAPASEAPPVAEVTVEVPADATA